MTGLYIVGVKTSAIRIKKVRARARAVSLKAAKLDEKSNEDRKSNGAIWISLNLYTERMGV